MADRAVNAELESVILEDPLEPAGWLIYGDWLQSEGDPRGELVAVQARLARDPGNAELMDAQRALFRQHGKSLLEGLDPFLIPADEHGPLFRLSWEFGFLWTANLAADGHSAAQMAEGLRALLRHPSARFLHALSIATPPENQWAPILAVLREERAPPLRILLVGGSARPAFGAIGDLSWLWARYPRLEIVALRGGVMNVGALDLPRLRELTIETSALARETVIAIGARERADLQRLEIWFGDRRCTATIAELAPIFEGARFPRLVHLGLRNCAFVDRICHALGRAPIAAQLHVLDLSLGALTDTGAAALIDAKEALKHLAVLDLSHHYFQTDWRAELASLAKFVACDSELTLTRAHIAPTVWIDT